MKLLAEILIFFSCYIRSLYKNTIQNKKIYNLHYHFFNVLIFADTQANIHSIQADILAAKVRPQPVSPAVHRYVAVPLILGVIEHDRQKLIVQNIKLSYSNILHFSFE